MISSPRRINIFTNWNELDGNIRLPMWLICFCTFPYSSLMHSMVHKSLRSSYFPRLQQTSTDPVLELLLALSFRRVIACSTLIFTSLYVNLIWILLVPHEYHNLVAILGTPHTHRGRPITHHKPYWLVCYAKHEISNTTLSHDSPMPPSRLILIKFQTTICSSIHEVDYHLQNYISNQTSYQLTGYG